MYIKPKAGRLASGAYSTNSPIKGDPFPHRGAPVNPAPSGGPFGSPTNLAMPNNRVTTPAENPLDTMRNTATQKAEPALTQVGLKQISPTGTVPLIQPQEKGTFFNRKVVPVDKTQFGATTSGKANTPFHPQPQTVVPQSAPKSSVYSERLNPPSFFSTGNLWGDKNNSFISGVASPGTGKVGVGRWQITKRGAV